jgi:hypothetical protein
MKPEEAKRRAAMSLEADEELAGFWVTPPIPGTGIYKLIAKKKADGIYEWSHFIQRADGCRDVVLRGTVDTRQQLDLVVTTADRNLRKFFGPAFGLRPAEFTISSLDGKEAPPTLL